jgi:YhcH/YjgK/YiaL family protein
MLYARLELRHTYQPLLRGDAWDAALQWLRDMPPGIAPGIHPLRGDHMYANVHGYETRERAACRFESHRRYVDLQYCVDGAEAIEWHPISNLVPSDEYDVGKDVRHYRAPPVADGQVLLSRGSFAVFLPEDGHMPKIAATGWSRVSKVVIKIDRGLFE